MDDSDKKSDVNMTTSSDDSFLSPKRPLALNFDTTGTDSESPSILGGLKSSPISPISDRSIDNSLNNAFSNVVIDRKRKRDYDDSTPAEQVLKKTRLEKKTLSDDDET